MGKMGAGAPEGNKNGTKLKEPEVRQMAYAQYCDHLAKGKSKRSFVFKHPQFSCTWETMEKYIKDEIEFDPLQKKIAEAHGFGVWEEVVEDSAIGKNKKANTASLQMLMRNKFDWDKVTDKESLVPPQIMQTFEDVMMQITKTQQQFDETSEKVISLD